MTGKEEIDTFRITVAYGWEDHDEDGGVLFHPVVKEEGKVSGTSVIAKVAIPQDPPYKNEVIYLSSKTLRRLFDKYERMKEYDLRTNAL